MKFKNLLKKTNKNNRDKNEKPVIEPGAPSEYLSQIDTDNPRINEFLREAITWAEEARNQILKDLTETKTTNGYKHLDERDLDKLEEVTTFIREAHAALGEEPPYQPVNKD